MEYGKNIRPIWLNDTRASHDRKRIVCFGDSFIMADNAIVGGVHLINRPFKDLIAHEQLVDDYRNNPEFAGKHQGEIHAFDESHRFFEKYTGNWMTKLAMKLDHDFTTYGLGGSGTHYAYYNMLRYLEFRNNVRTPNLNPPDVIIFVINSVHRVWNKDIPNVCPGSLMNNQQAMEAGTWEGTEKNRQIWGALGHYYADLFDGDHEKQQKVHLMHYFDTCIAPQYPETKFVILHAFPDVHNNNEVDDLDPANYAYFYDFKNCMEIRPPLMHLSRMDEMPDDLLDEIRPNHFSTRMHDLFSSYLFYQIQDFKPGGHFCPISLEQLENYQ